MGIVLAGSHHVMQVIILDEPTANMDPEGRREMWELLLKIRRSCSIFLTTQHLDEADVLGDRIAVMASARIRCIGSPTFLKQRFGTGYHMVINKVSNGCKVPEIEGLLHKYAPRVRLQTDSENKAVFILGQIVATRRIITMFRDLEQRSEELGIESVGMTLTSLEDVLIRVGEEHHLHNLQQQQQLDVAKNEQSVIEVKESVVKIMATTVSAETDLVGRVWALLAKRATCVWRQKKQPLFSWLLPPLLLTLLFSLEIQAMRRTERIVSNVGDSFLYTYGDLGQRPQSSAAVTRCATSLDRHMLPPVWFLRPRLLCPNKLKVTKSLQTNKHGEI
ncbi:phospholipid-transporting ATPase ABCA3-like [Amblyomma americanum]